MQVGVFDVYHRIMRIGFEVRECSSQFYVLEHYLRVATRNPGCWLSSLRTLTGSPKLSQALDEHTSQDEFSGRLAGLQGDYSNLCGLYVSSPISISGLNAESEAIIMPVSGFVKFKVRDQKFISTPNIPFVLEPSVGFEAELCPDSHIFIVQLSSDVPKSSSVGFESGDLNLGRLLDYYLIKTPFFKNHEDATSKTRAFEEALINYRESNSYNSALSENDTLVGDDRRLCRALILINEKLEDSIDLESIARNSGLSPDFS